MFFVPETTTESSYSPEKVNKCHNPPPDVHKYAGGPGPQGWGLDDLMQPFPMIVK